MVTDVKAHRFCVTGKHTCDKQQKCVVERQGLMADAVYTLGNYYLCWSRKHNTREKKGSWKVSRKVRSPLALGLPAEKECLGVFSLSSIAVLIGNRGENLMMMLLRNSHSHSHSICCTAEIGSCRCRTVQWESARWRHRRRRGNK